MFSSLSFLFLSFSLFAGNGIEIFALSNKRKENLPCNNDSQDQTQMFAPSYVLFSTTIKRFSVEEILLLSFLLSGYFVMGKEQLKDLFWNIIIFLSLFSRYLVTGRERLEDTFAVFFLRFRIKHQSCNSECWRFRDTNIIRRNAHTFRIHSGYMLLETRI